MQRFALGLIVLSALAIALAYAAAFLPGDTPAWAPWLLAAGTATIIMAAMMLGAMRSSRAVRALAAPLLVTYFLLAGSFALALLLTEADPAHPVLWLGLPRAAAAVLYGIGVLPMFVLPLAYALTFDRTTLSREDWERIRAAARARAAHADPTADVGRVHE